MRDLEKMVVFSGSFLASTGRVSRYGAAFLLASHTLTQALIFNVDSKSASTAKSDSNAIVIVLNRVFNEKLG